MWDRKWCRGRESNPYGLAAEGFSSHYGFRRQLAAVRALDYAFTVTFARFRCSPSSLYTFPL